MVKGCGVSPAACALRASAMSLAQTPRNLFLASEVCTSSQQMIEMPLDPAAQYTATRIVQPAVLLAVRIDRSTI